MDIHIHDEQKDFPLLSHKHKITALIHFVLDQENRSCDEIGIFFVTDGAMRALHKKFFNDPSPTDCMSFPIDTDYLGDIVVCPKIALNFQNPFEEVLLYVLHGLLHLLGYDDIGPKDRKIMRKKEQQYMNHIRLLRLNEC